jgi:tight adherence protein C
MLAIYAAVTVKRSDGQAREGAQRSRREQLKAGITPPPRSAPASFASNETTDKMKDTLSALKVLQESQLATIQQKLAQAGIRKKEWAVAVVFARMVHAIVLGGFAAMWSMAVNYFPEWGTMKKFGLRRRCRRWLQGSGNLPPEHDHQAHRR